MKYFSVICAFLVSCSLADKPSPTYTSANSISPAGSKPGKTDSYGSPIAPAASSAPAAHSHSHGHAHQTYSAPAPAAPQSYSAAAPAAAAPQQAGEVGNQGYYYYYYPVGSESAAAGGAGGATPYAGEVEEGGLGGLLAGKGLIVALIIGVVIVLAVMGTSISFGGRSYNDLTTYAADHMDDITGLVMRGLEMYRLLNNK